MSNFNISISVSWQGRLRRRTFWCTFLMIVVINLVGGSILEDAKGAAAVLSLLLLPFELSLIVRRSQDAGLRDEIKYFLVGAHILLAILGIVLDEDAYTGSMGMFVLLVSLGYIGGLIAFLSKDSVPGTNKWGPNPKEAGAPVVQADSRGTPKQVCPTCSGSGKNAVGYVCPRCGGRGFLS